MKAKGYMCGLHCPVCQVYFNALLLGSNKRCCKNNCIKCINAYPIGISLRLQLSQSLSIPCTKSLGERFLSLFRVRNLATPF